MLDRKKKACDTCGLQDFTSYMEPYPHLIFVMPGGIPFSICHVCDPSNFMVSKCNFLHQKKGGLLDGWLEGKCSKRLGGLVSGAG